MMCLIILIALISVTAVKSDNCDYNTAIWNCQQASQAQLIAIHDERTHNLTFSRCYAKGGTFMCWIGLEVSGCVYNQQTWQWPSNINYKDINIWEWSDGIRLDDSSYTNWCAGYPKKPWKDKSICADRYAYMDAINHCWKHGWDGFWGENSDNKYWKEYICQTKKQKEIIELNVDQLATKYSPSQIQFYLIIFVLMVTIIVALLYCNRTNSKQIEQLKAEIQDLSITKSPNIRQRKYTASNEGMTWQ
eukprot:UN02761